jgi:hypothetical protein
MVSVTTVVSYGEEILPMYVKDNYLYINVNRGTNDTGPGYIDKLDLNTGRRTTVATVPRYAAWQGVVDYIGGRVVKFGQLGDAGGVLRSGVVVFDPSSDSVSTAYHPDTGDTNEFIGVAYDHGNRRFIVGERQYGGDTSGSNWPNGGGLWVIPYDRLLDYTGWMRVYEFPNSSEVTSVAVFRDNVYVGLWRAGQFTRVSVARINALTSWSDLRSGLNPNVRPYVDAEDNLLAIGYGTSDGRFRVEWTSDGSTWNGVNVTPSSTDSDMLMNVKVVGRYIVVGVGKQPSWRSDLFIVDTNTGSVARLYVNMVGSINNKPFLYDGRQRLYIGTVNLGGAESAVIYSLVFDGRRILSLSVPPVAGPGETITLTATLTDGANPVPNAVVEFYVVDSVCAYSPAGRLIGTATTDSNGRASVRYTIPSTGRFMFAAIYKG